MTLLPVQRDPEQPQLPHNDPLGELRRLRRELTRLVDSWPAFTTFFGESFTPGAKVADVGEAYVVKLELPDVARDGVAVSIAGRRLTVASAGDATRTWLRRSRSLHLGHFSYEVVFPGSVEQEQVTAALDSGTLTVRAPKPSAGRPRRLDVK